jgi:hypothetical protein
MLLMIIITWLSTTALLAWLTTNNHLQAMANYLLWLCHWMHQKTTQQVCESVVELHACCCQIVVSCLLGLPGAELDLDVLLIITYDNAYVCCRRLPLTAPHTWVSNISPLEKSRWFFLLMCWSDERSPSHQSIQPFDCQTMVWACLPLMRTCMHACHNQINKHVRLQQRQLTRVTSCMHVCRLDI